MKLKTVCAVRNRTKIVQLYAKTLREGVSMERTSSPSLVLINKVLRASFDAIVHDPLPPRWMDLIQHLNDLERAEREGDYRDERQQETLQAHRQPR